MPAPSSPSATLPETAIQKDALIWYHGRMSLGSWNCPAIVTDVDKKKRLFHVMSLDDFEKQPQDYEFDLTEYSPESRRSMRPASNAEVRQYLIEVERQFVALVRDASRRDLSGARSKLNRVRKLMASLSK